MGTSFPNRILLWRIPILTAQNGGAESSNQLPCGDIVASSVEAVSDAHLLPRVEHLGVECVSWRDRATRNDLRYEGLRSAQCVSLQRRKPNNPLPASATKETCGTPRQRLNIAIAKHMTLRWRFNIFSCLPPQIILMLKLRPTLWVSLAPRIRLCFDLFLMSFEIFVGAGFAARL